jgi:hypothetical protein
MERDEKTDEMLALLAEQPRTLVQVEHVALPDYGYGPRAWYFIRGTEIRVFERELDLNAWYRLHWCRWSDEFRVKRKFEVKP